MAAKLLVHAPTRLEAIKRMRRCLEEFALEGFATNAELSYQILYLSLIHIWDAGRGGVAVFGDIFIVFFRRNMVFPDHQVDDPGVGLVKDEEIHIVHSLSSPG